MANSSSDTAITAKIKAKYAMERDLSVFGISVNTTDGRVTLAGNVTSHAQIGRAMLIALETDASDGPLLHLGMVLLHPRTSLMKRRAVGLPDVPGFLVHAVEPGSWADETGFRKGDLICHIEGRAVDSLVELRRVLNSPRPRIKRFMIRRGTEAIEL